MLNPLPHFMSLSLQNDITATQHMILNQENCVLCVYFLFYITLLGRLSERRLCTTISSDPTLRRKTRNPPSLSCHFHTILYCLYDSRKRNYILS